MKLLHTSDWHLGARLGRHDRTPDHVEALRGLLSLAESARPDLILHTGDLFDASRPPYEALELGVQALRRLSAIAPTLVLSGNHDSSVLLCVIDELAGAAAPRRLRLVTRPEVVEYPDIAPEPVAVACVPFIAPSAIANYATDDLSRFEGNYADGIRTLNDGLLDEAQRIVGTRGIVLYAAHLHVQGARPGKSERRITVGEDYATHVEGLQRALYCAFGHIHDPQLLPGGTAQGRYAGSLIPLDFGERRQAKRSTRPSSRTRPSCRGALSTAVEVAWRMGRRLTVRKRRLSHAAKKWSGCSASSGCSTSSSRREGMVKKHDQRRSCSTHCRSDPRAGK